MKLLFPGYSYLPIEGTLTLDEWVETQNPDGPCVLEKYGIDKLEQPFDSGVIGFEMPRSYMGWMEKIGIPYMNIMIHPCRFMTDIVFGVKTHIRFNHYLGNEVYRSEMRVAADEYREWMKQHPVDIPFIPSDHMVVGQSEFDRSVLWGGKFHNVTEFVDVKRKTYRRHPNEQQKYSPEPHEKVSIYRYFDRLKTIEGMNSSALYEAEFFGINTIYHGPKWWDGYMPIMGKDLFGIKSAGPNFFRTLFNAWWGYERGRNV